MTFTQQMEKVASCGSPSNRVGIAKAARKVMRMRFLTLFPFAMAASLLTGCTTVTVYQNPISQFQQAVNAANDSIRPYLINVNSLVYEANLYDKVGEGNPWGTEDFTGGLPEPEIQIRLQALSTIASYANALSAVANAKDVQNLQDAAKTLGEDVNGLSQTIGSVADFRQKSPPKGEVGSKAATLDLSAPVSSLVTLFGTSIIERLQKAAVEKAILDGDAPVRKLIELLKADLQGLTLVDQTSYASIQRGTVKLYNDARSKTDPKGLVELIDDLVQRNSRFQTLRALQVDSLLSGMGSAHAALVTFAKSSKGPKDLASLSAQIDVFTAQVKLFQNALESLEAAAKPPK